MKESEAQSLINITWWMEGDLRQEQGEAELRRNELSSEYL